MKCRPIHVSIDLWPIIAIIAGRPSACPVNHITQSLKLYEKIIIQLALLGRSHLHQLGLGQTK